MFDQQLAAIPEQDLARNLRLPHTPHHTHDTMFLF